MDQFQELRYPFTSVVDFIAGGYWLQRAGWHLTLGGVVLAVLSARVLLQRRPLLQKLTILYFSTAVFNNPAYSIAGFRFGELCGLAAGVLVAVAMLDGRRFSLDRIGVPLVLAGMVIAVHAALIAVAYPSIDRDWQTQLVRAILIGRIVILGLVIVGIEETFSTAAEFLSLARSLVAFGTAAALIYVFQAGIFLSGTLPYGTYWDAGFTGVPSFGSVSIERGHFGKFLIMLFPAFVLTLAKFRWRLPLVVLVGVSLVNFSASSFAFLCGYAAITAWLLRRELLRPAVVATMVVGAGAVAALASTFGAQYGGIVAKLVELGLRGDATGGRGFSVLATYLSAYPLGTSFGGSSLRVIRGLPEINMGAFALVAQLSVVALPLALAYFWLNYRVVRQSGRIVDDLTRGALLCGVLMSIFIGAVDILWFVPTLWFPLVMCNGLTYAAYRPPEAWS